jgi:hypothetical protein
MRDEPALHRLFASVSFVQSDAELVFSVKI